jgi:hypothetical protein
MRALALVMVFAGCENAHIDLRFDVALTNQCGAAAPGNPGAPMSCDQMTLDCATHLQLRVREVKDDKPGNVLSQRCHDLSRAGNPRDLCALGSLDNPLSLIESVPHGTRFIFQLAALRLFDPAGGDCDDEVHRPIRVFSGFSDPVLVDGNDHALTVHLSNCDSCGNLPIQQPSSDLSLAAVDLGMAISDMSFPTDAFLPADGGPDFASPRPDLSERVCPIGQKESPYFPEGARCCDEPPPLGCKKPGDDCGDNTVALLPPGGCCAVCDGL